MISQEEIAHAIAGAWGKPELCYEQAERVFTLLQGEPAIVGRPLEIQREDAKMIACGLLADGLDVSKLSETGRAELRAAINKLLELSQTS